MSGSTRKLDTQRPISPELRSRFNITEQALCSYRLKAPDWQTIHRDLIVRETRQKIATMKSPHWLIVPPQKVLSDRDFLRLFAYATSEEEVEKMTELMLQMRRSIRGSETGSWDVLVADSDAGGYCAYLRGTQIVMGMSREYQGAFLLVNDVRTWLSSLFTHTWGRWRVNEGQVVLNPLSVRADEREPIVTGLDACSIGCVCISRNDQSVRFQGASILPAVLVGRY
jgi:hypothetical protein